MLITINLTSICPFSLTTLESHGRQQEQKKLPLIVAIFNNIIYHAPQIHNLRLANTARYYVSITQISNQKIGFFKLIEKNWQSVALTACYGANEFHRIEAQYELYTTISTPWISLFRTNFPRPPFSNTIISAFAAKYQKWLPILEKLSDTLIDFRTVSDTLRGHLAHFLPDIEAKKLRLTLIQRDSRKVLTQDLLAPLPEKHKRKREESEESIPKKIKYPVFPEPEELFQPFETLVNEATKFGL